MNINKKISAFASSTFLLWTLTILDILSIGTKLYSIESHGDSLISFNMTIYIVNCIISQCIYGGLSSLKVGICAGPIYESVSLTSNIQKICENYTKNSTESITNTFVVIFISTLFFALVSYVLGRFNFGKLLHYIPKNVLYGVMTSIGVNLIKESAKEIYVVPRNAILDLCLFITISLAFLAIYLETRFSKFIFFLPAFSCSILCFFYIIFFTLGFDINWLRNNNFLPQTDSSYITYKSIFKFIDFSTFRPNIMIKCIPDMINIIFTNLIHITVNIPIFCNIMNINANINKEFKVQAYGNLISAFFGYPTYFINCHSFFFNKSGGTSKLYSISAGLSLVFMLYFGPKARNILPCILLAFIPMYIGFSFIFSNFIIFLNILPYHQLFIILISAIVGYFFNTLGGLIVGIIVSIVINYYKKV